ncbi:hypothetical protein PVAP13_4KG127800 [Panicum virgatum]|uniref:Disease resistance N-terminal domain-containing protein n=1 Tax=Panicum virgatum TaxID=38727 RepID=A0A8T0TU01_PANVG|nr:hypothetical protein PVAP13_4KG127800 [Panicum virgatum]
METMVASVFKGVLSPLLANLTTLTGDEFKKLKGVRKQASFLNHELSNMNAFLETLDLAQRCSAEVNPCAAGSTCARRSATGYGQRHRRFAPGS